MMSPCRPPRPPEYRQQSTVVVKKKKKLKSKAATVHITWQKYSSPIMSHVKMSGTINNDSTTFDTLHHVIMYLIIGHTCPYD